MSEQSEFDEKVTRVVVAQTLRDVATLLNEIAAAHTAPSEPTPDVLNHIAELLRVRAYETDPLTEMLDD